MWINYANNHSGCCCVFTIDNYEMINPVVYCEKKRITFTDDMIFSIKHSNTNILDDRRFKRIAILPFVLKDAEKYEKEHEIRLLCQDVYDDSYGVLNGRIAIGKKQKMGYTGINYPYTKCGVSLQKIIIGYNTPQEIIEQLKLLNTQIEIETL